MCVLSAVNCCLWATSNTSGQQATDSTTKLAVTVIDLSGNLIENAVVKVVECGITAKTDANGQTGELILSNLPAQQLDWCGLTVTVTRSGYVNTAVIDCVVYYGRTRTLKVRMYDDDGSLPYVCYVECPPSEYVEGLFD